MTIKVKRLLEYTVFRMHAELQFAKLDLFRAKDRLQDLIVQRDFASYHSKEDVESCKEKIKVLSEILQKISIMENDIKYFKNKSLKIYKNCRCNNARNDAELVITRLVAIHVK